MQQFRHKLFRYVTHWYTIQSCLGGCNQRSTISIMVNIEHMVTIAYFLQREVRPFFFSSLLCYKHFCIGSILTMRIYMKTKHNFIKNSAFVFSDFYLLGFFLIGFCFYYWLIFSEWQIYFFHLPWLFIFVSYCQEFQLSCYRCCYNSPIKFVGLEFF